MPGSNMVATDSISDRNKWVLVIVGRVQKYLSLYFTLLF